MAKKAWVMVKKGKTEKQKKDEAMVKKVVNKTINQQSEWKHHTRTTTIAVDDVGVMTDHCAVAQGDADTDRDGDQIMAYSMNFRYTYGGADNTNVARIIFFQWFPQSTPAINDILIFATGYEVLSMYNTDKADQYKILYDRTFDFELNGAGTLETHSRSGKIKLSRKKIKYNAGTTVGSNKVYSLVVSDSTAIAHPGFFCVTKLNYRDN